MTKYLWMLSFILCATLFFSGCVSGDDNTAEILDIVENYAATHTYLEEDFFLCGDFAVDVWNMITTRGLNATIQVGNINKSVSNFTGYNHVWIMAEVKPSEWLAFETTSGQSISREENLLYYEGVSFNSLANFREYSDLLKLRNFQARKVKKELGVSKPPCDAYNVAVARRDELQEEFETANQTNQTNETLVALQADAAAQQALVDEKEIACVAALNVYEGELEELAEIDKRIIAVLDRASG